MIGMPKMVWISTMPGSVPKRLIAANARTSGNINTW